MVDLPFAEDKVEIAGCIGVLGASLRPLVKNRLVPIMF